MRTEKEKLQREIIDALYDRYNNKEYCTELVCEAMDIWHEQQVNNLDKADVSNNEVALIALLKDIKFSYINTGGIMPQEMERLNKAINDC